MADASPIEWTDATQNFHIGCQKVGPGCDHCYAEAWNGRFDGGKNWGPGAPRRRTSAAIWNNPLKWQRQADEFERTHGRRRRVFASSLSDIMDNAIPLEESREAFDIMERCDRLVWQMLTKRVGNVEARVPEHWTKGAWPRHVGLMITVVNQPEAFRDVPKLRKLKARFDIPWVGISFEPALGAVALSPWLDEIDWVIAGGESGPNARTAFPFWFRLVRHQCESAGVPFLFKQWGEWAPASEVGSFGFEDKPRIHMPPVTMIRVGRRNAGRHLDGKIHNQFPDFTRSAPWAPQGQVAAGR